MVEADKGNAGLLLQVVGLIGREAVADNKLGSSLHERLFIDGHAARTAIADNGQAGEQIVIHVTVRAAHIIFLLGRFDADHHILSLQVAHGAQCATNSNDALEICGNLHATTAHVGDGLSLSIRTRTGFVRAASGEHGSCEGECDRADADAQAQPEL